MLSSVHPDPNSSKRQPTRIVTSQPVLVGVPVYDSQIQNPGNEVQSGFPIDSSTNSPERYSLMSPSAAQGQKQAGTSYSKPSSEKSSYIELNRTNHNNSYINAQGSDHAQRLMTDTNMLPGSQVHPQELAHLPNMRRNSQPGDNTETPNPHFTPIDAQMFGQVETNAASSYIINSRQPQLALCRDCNKYVQTNVKYEVGSGTLISCAFVAILGAIPCACIPCCIKDLKDAVHYCPCCKLQLGKKKFTPN